MTSAAVDVNCVDGAVERINEVPDDDARRQLGMGRLDPHGAMRVEPPHAQLPPCIIIGYLIDSFDSAVYAVDIDRG